MFTGIVQTKATVIAIEDQANFRRLGIETSSEHLKQLTIGASIAINGCCLTATAFDDTQVWFDVIDETLRLTNLGAFQVGDTVNFERSLKLGDEIGGHHVSGHIHDVATVAAVSVTEHNWELWLEFDKRWAPYIFAKGFIAVNGASLTIGKVEGTKFSLHLIPETLRLTNLEQAEMGTRLNLEIDQQTMTIVDTVERVLAQRQLSSA